VLALGVSKLENRNSKTEIRKSRLEIGSSNPQARNSPVVRMRLLGANPAAKITGERELPGKINYFLGNDPEKWRVGVPTYTKVRYAGIYPGIDLVYHGSPSGDGPTSPSADGSKGPPAGGKLEFDFVAAPRADPRLIRLRFGPPNRLRLAANGDLVVTTANGALVFHKPLVYQMVGGERQPVTGEFALLEKHTVGFRLGSYDRAKTLVIDPALAFSTFVGGSTGDAGNAIAVDSAGNVYVAGQTLSSDFPMTPGAFQTTKHAAGGNTVFVTKLNPTGTALVYSTYLGGSFRETASAIAVDTAGNAYVAGQTASTDFPVTQGAFQTTNRAAVNGDANAFITKLNPTGTALVYSTYLGGSGLAAEPGDRANAIATDAAGNVYLAGQTYSTDFPVTQGAFQTSNNCTANECANAFVTKLNPTGTALIYSTYLGGSGGNRLGYFGDIGNAIATDMAGDAYVTGQAGSSDFPVTPGAFQSTNRAAANEGSDAFITKLNPAGTALVYSTYLGGSGNDTGNAITLDSAGNVYMAGKTASIDFPVTPGAFQTTCHATNYGSNAFIAKLNPGGTALVYSTYLGGSGADNDVNMTWGGDAASGLAIDSAGNTYVTGTTSSTDFPVTQGAYQTTNNDQPPCGGVVNYCIGGYNAFITELSSTGSTLVYSTYLGGNGINNPEGGSATLGDQASALALDSSGNVYVTGLAGSYDFPVTEGAFQTTLNAYYGSAFVAKLNMSAPSTAITPTVTVTPASSNITMAQSLTVTVSVSGGSGNPAPTGTVTLASGTYASPATTLTAGSATINIPSGSLLVSLPQSFSPDELIARYLPDTASASNYNFSSGLASVYVDALNISATPSSSTLTWAQAQSQPLPVVIGVTAATGDPVPTGTVTLSTGSWSSAATALSGGSATITIPLATLTTGVNVLDVNYSGDSNYAPVSGPYGSVTVGSVTLIAPTVSATPSSSTLTWAQAQSQPLPVVIGVTGGTGNPVPTGTVTLTTGSWSSAATALSGGSATITIPPATLTTGVNVLNVNYSGDSNYAPISGHCGSVTVGSVTLIAPNVLATPSSSTLTWAQAQSQPLPVAIGVTGGAGNPVPTGTVTLTTGSWSSAATALSSGSATITIPPATLTTGVNVLNVSYSGDINYALASGAYGSVTVGSITVSVVPSSATINSTQALPVTITVSAGSGSPMPTGMVTLTSGSYTSAATPLTGGSATITIPAGTLPLGVDVLNVSYGNGNYAGASGQASVTVTGPPGFTITGTAVTVTAGAITGDTSTITVTPSGGFTGSVALTAAVTSSPSGAVDPPTLSFGSTSPVNISGTAAGTATLTMATTAPNPCVNAAYQSPRGVFWYTGGGAALACVLLFGVPARRRRWRVALAVLALLVTLVGGWLACGGGGGIRNCGPIIPGTTAGTYAITVTGTSGSTMGAGTVTLTVQ
jgi:hypothetical protein